MSTNPEVRSKATRRVFTAAEKARILAEYDGATSSLARASLMRREGVYSSLLSNWRKQLASGAPAKRGRPANPEAAENARLIRELEKLKRRLERSEMTVAALGKAHALLQMIASGSNAEDERSKSS